ncbi:MAG TPA: nitrilase-related carbon-nitrogen hydrolase, partial [Armatimonadota bacterium]
AHHYNTALIVASSGAVLGKYLKQHPVQTMEATTIAGRASPTFPTPAGRLGVAICYDFDYSAVTWQLVRHGAELLIVPTYDAESWSDLQHVQHARMAQARAAEAGRWVVRATSSGVSQIITPRGEVMASLPNHASAAVRATVYPLAHRTPYIKLGYLLPTACVYLAILLLLLAACRRQPELPRMMPHSRNHS